MTDVINKTGVRRSLGDLRVSSDVYAAVEEKVQRILDEAADRATASGRTTVQARDV